MEFRCGNNPWWRFCVMWARIGHQMKMQEPWEMFFRRPLGFACMGILRGEDGLWSPCRREDRHRAFEQREPRVPEWARE